MNSAAARAAIRRGSSIRILRAPSHGASSSAGGTCVVLPAPGGASRTRRGWRSSERLISPSSGVIGISARAMLAFVVGTMRRVCGNGAIVARSTRSTDPRKTDPATRAGSVGVACASSYSQLSPSISDNRFHVREPDPDGPPVDASVEPLNVNSSVLQSGQLKLIVPQLLLLTLEKSPANPPPV